MFGVGATDGSDGPGRHGRLPAGALPVRPTWDHPRTPRAHRLAVGGATGRLPRKEVIQPQLPLRLPCYDFVPVSSPALGACLPKVSPATSGVATSHDVTGGVYKARERIHRGVLTRGY